MPSPTLTALHDFESQFHYAVQSILSDAGIAAYIPGQRVEYPDDATLVKFKRGAALGDQTKRPNGRIEYNRYSGTLEITSRIRAAANTASTVLGCNRVLDERCGLIRTLFLKSERKFTLGKLPWLAVTDIVPQEPDKGVDDTASAQRDAFTERWEITFEILPEAWPS